MLQFVRPLCDSTRTFGSRLQAKPMKRMLLVIAVGAVYILHQDFWFWRAAHPLIFGFIPIGLFYHACFTLAGSLVMWLLVRQAWPSHLEEETTGGLGDWGTGRKEDQRRVAPSPRRPVASSEEGDAR